jgi:hypothetical protein
VPCAELAPQVTEGCFCEIFPHHVTLYTFLLHFKGSQLQKPHQTKNRILQEKSGLFITAIPHKERLATLHAICLQISLQSLFRIFPHASCVHIFRDISGKYSKIHKGFSPFFPSSLKKSDDAICMRQIRNRLSYFTKMLVNTSSIHSAFCFI